MRILSIGSCKIGGDSKRNNEFRLKNSEEMTRTNTPVDQEQETAEPGHVRSDFMVTSCDERQASDMPDSPFSPTGIAFRQVSPAVVLLQEVVERIEDIESAATSTLPRPFNPRHEAWLPILHTERNGRRYTALFSNTERAHRLGRTRDWVVLYFDDPRGKHQCTVVTECQAPLRGRRVVRGREMESAEHHGVAIEPLGEVLWFEPTGSEEKEAASPAVHGASVGGRL